MANTSARPQFQTGEDKMGLGAVCEATPQYILKTRALLVHIALMIYIFYVPLVQKILGPIQPLHTVIGGILHHLWPPLVLAP